MNDRRFNTFSRLLATAALCYGSAVSAFGFNMGDSFNEGFDFDEGSDLDMGGSRMNWESPDNVWDTGTSSHKGFSWGGGPRSGPGWGFRDAAPQRWMPPAPQQMPYGGQPMMMPTPYGWAPVAPPQPQVYSRPPAPPAPTAQPERMAQ